MLPPNVVPQKSWVFFLSRNIFFLGYILHTGENKIEMLDDLFQRIKSFKSIKSKCKDTQYKENAVHQQKYTFVCMYV